jgi:CheY-like chemotaxis protein
MHWNDPTLMLPDTDMARVSPGDPEIPKVAVALSKHEAGESSTHEIPGRVLLAEDDPVNAMLAEATLDNLGVKFTRVENGQQALSELTRLNHPYSLVLMDCQMPELDGIEATRSLRAWEHAQGRQPVPVVALTANAMASDRDRCLAAGMDAHLAKPFRRSELRALLLRYMPGPDQHADSRITA